MPRKPDKDPNRPKGRMTAYAYFLQMCREEHRRQYPSEQVNFQEFSKKCAERWRSMSDGEKKKFLDMASKDKVRYDKEMSGYQPPAGVKKRKRAKKDPNAPKRSLSAFLYFSQDERPKVKAGHPNWGVADCAKELGKRWGAAPQKQRDKYEKMAERDKERYGREIAVWKAKLKK